MEITRFANPHLLWILLLLLPMIGYYIYRTLQGGATIQISSVNGVESSKRTIRYYLRHIPFVLRCIAISLLIIALARPQSSEYESNTITEGIDIVLAIDVSTSMLAQDFNPNRISVARQVASQFIMDRPNDRIGIVIFAGESFTQSPLTTDKRALLSLMAQVKDGLIEDGTAIGNGLSTAINRLRESEASSKVVILLTDGVNNAGQITPLTAAEIAETLGIKVYTIGVGTIGIANYPAYDAWGRIVYVPMRVEIDEEVLRQIASQTGGEYFRATDGDKLREVYSKINELEKSKIDANDYINYRELFYVYLLWGFALLVLEFLLNNLMLRRIP